jgi:hypothetical protein
LLDRKVPGNADGTGSLGVTVRGRRRYSRKMKSGEQRHESKGGGSAANDHR